MQALRLLVVRPRKERVAKKGLVAKGKHDIFGSTHVRWHVNQLLERADVLHVAGDGVLQGDKLLTRSEGRGQRCLPLVAIDGRVGHAVAVFKNGSKRRCRFALLAVGISATRVTGAEGGKVRIKLLQVGALLVTQKQKIFLREADLLQRYSVRRQRSVCAKPCGEGERRRWRLSCGQL